MTTSAIEVEKDPKYPIASVHFGWVEPDGSFNSQGVVVMALGDQPENVQVHRALEHWWHGRVLDGKGMPDGGVSVKDAFFYRESWCMTWFQHWTFDRGQTDNEAIYSFELYVRRHERYQDQIPLPKGGICLMGAEDRWRWRGSDNTFPPCRCEYCARRGILMIAH